VWCGAVRRYALFGWSILCGVGAVVLAIVLLSQPQADCDDSEIALCFRFSDGEVVAFSILAAFGVWLSGLLCFALVNWLARRR
jgi:Na+/proline symporter